MSGDTNHIAVIESLSDELKTGKELYEDCIRRNIDFKGKSISHRYHSVHSKDNFIEILKYYEINSKYMEGGLLFHLEMHGAENKSGLVLSNGELIEWEELTNHFRPINISTCNKLFITMATCYGRYLCKGVNQFEKSPFSGFISASLSVQAGEIQEVFTYLFERLIDKGNIVEAYLVMEKLKSKFYYKDSKRVLEEAIASTINKLKDNEKMKMDFINESRKQMINDGFVPGSLEDSQKLFSIVINDYIEKQKKSFQIDCE
ncbi:hypothetical protein [Aequorivita sp. KMM 9714]|uniref:hypothetical protein n=1 Tax=Aequorivita sp. KMM 9714 TaxID=2707173 RepID=UPI0013EC2446|nr:hypothetical protein [Aequorivita sp. KMM 9714]NGX85272.1 hypothetical protein [Aequorivita sp. KMM 9714]